MEKSLGKSAMNETKFKTIVYLDGAGSTRLFQAIDNIAGSEGIRLFIETRIDPCINAGLQKLGLSRYEVENRNAEGDDFRGEFHSARDAHEFVKEFHKKAQEINEERGEKFWFRVAAITAKVGFGTENLFYEGERLPIGTPFIRLCRLRSEAEPGSLLVDKKTFEMLPAEIQSEYGDEKEIVAKHNDKFIARQWKSPYSAPESYKLSLMRSNNLSGVSDKYLVEMAPHRDKELFTGRENIFKEIEENFVKKRIQIIYALGGVGKTTTALEYAYRCVENKKYQSVFWISADNEDILLSGFKQVAEAIGLENLGLSSAKSNKQEDEESDRSIYKQQVFNWLKQEENGSWLIVYDNADDSTVGSAQKWLRRLFPEGEHGRILITSRSAYWKNRSDYAPILLPYFNENDALTFLEKRLEIPIIDTPEEEIVKELASELGYFPLALEQASAYIRNHDNNIQNFLDRFKKRRLLILDKYSPETGPYGDENSNKERQDHLTVGTTWILNFEQISEVSRAASELLEIAAFLYPDNIPLQIFFEKAHILGGHIEQSLQGDEEKAEEGMEDILLALASYSLISRRQEKVGIRKASISIHRLVQEVIRTHLLRERSKQQAILSKLVTCLYELTEFDYLSVRSAMWGIHLDWAKSDGAWEHFSMLFPHSKIVLKCAEDLELVSKNIFALYNFVADYLREEQSYSAAVTEGYEKAIIVAVKLNPDLKFSDLKVTLNVRLAATYGRMKRFQESLNLLEKAEESIRETNSSDYGFLKAYILKNKASVYQRQKKYNEAEDTYCKALSMVEEDPDLTDLKPSILNSLGNCYRDWGKFDEAIMKYIEVAELPKFFEENPTQAHLGDLRGRHNLAKALAGKGEFEEAEGLHLSVLEERKKAYGSEHPITAESFAALGMLYRNWGKSIRENEKQKNDYLIMSEKNLKKAYDISCQYNKLSDPRIESPLHNLISIYNLLGKYSEVKNLLTTAMRECEATLNDEESNPIHIGFIYRNLAVYYQNVEQDFSKAEVYFQYAVERDDQFDACETNYESLKLQGFFYQYRANKCKDSSKEEAKNFYLLSIQSLETATLHEDISTKVKSEIHCKLGEIYRSLVTIIDTDEKEGYRQKAENNYISAKDLNDQFLGEGNIHSARISKDLGVTYLRSSRKGKDEDRLDKAIQSLSNALIIFQNSGQEQAGSVVFIEDQLIIAAVFSKELGLKYLDSDPDKAILFLEKALQIYSKNGQKHGSTIRFIERKLNIAKQGRRDGRRK